MGRILGRVIVICIFLGPGISSLPVPVEEKDILDILKAAGFNETIMTTQSSIFASESGEIRGQAIIAAPILHHNTPDGTNGTQQNKTEPPIHNEETSTTGNFVSSTLSTENTTVETATKKPSVEIQENGTSSTELTNSQNVNAENVTMSESTSQGDIEQLNKSVTSTTELSATVIPTTKDSHLSFSNTTWDHSSENNESLSKNTTFPSKLADEISSLFFLPLKIEGKEISFPQEPSRFTFGVSIDWLARKIRIFS